MNICCTGNHITIHSGAVIGDMLRANSTLLKLNLNREKGEMKLGEKEQQDRVIEY